MYSELVYGSATSIRFFIGNPDKVTVSGAIWLGNGYQTLFHGLPPKIRRPEPLAGAIVVSPP